MTTFNNISINSNGCACRPGKALTKVDWANIYLAYLDIIDVNVGQSVSLARLLLIGTANEPKERHDIRAENQPHVAQMLEAINNHASMDMMMRNEKMPPPSCLLPRI
eukprot:scaffold453_cov278-Chaetoceros_neogracile.AAC.30